MFRRNREPDDKFVIMKGILPTNSLCRFFTTLDESDDELSITSMDGGGVAYTILGYAKTSEEAIAALDYRPK